MFTFLSIAFLALLVFAIIYGYGIVVRRPPTKEELETGFCSLCRRRVDKSQLVERHVGDSRLFWFCHDCIRSLGEEMSHQTPNRKNLSV